MLHFAMDCWMGGGAVILIYQIFSQLIQKGRLLSQFDCLLASIYMGLALFMLARFFMGLFIIWSMWE